MVSTDTREQRMVGRAVDERQAYQITNWARWVLIILLPLQIITMTLMTSVFFFHHDSKAVIEKTTEGQRKAVEALVCVLRIPPPERSNGAVRDCLNEITSDPK